MLTAAARGKTWRIDRSIRLAPAPAAPRRSPAFLAAVALANAGGVIAYLPLLTLLLPIKIEEVASEARIGVLAAAAIAGAVSASGANILWGWLSDRSLARGGGRRRWMAAGLAATAASFAGVLVARDALGLVIAVVAFQAAVNLLLAPFFALMADEVPDGQKGIAGGLLALAGPLAAGVSALLTQTAALGEAARYAILALAMASCTAPLLLVPARPATVPPPAADTARLLRRDLAIAWLARLLVQVAGCVVSLYLLYYVESLAISAAVARARVGTILTLAFAIPLPVAVVAGRLSDRLRRRKPFLAGAAFVAAIGLCAMALARDWSWGAAGFVVYALGSAVFLALHSVFAMQLLPDPRRRGRDLGLVNLTNTLPSLLGPALAWWLATPRDFAALFFVLAALSAAGGIAILGIKGRR